MAAFFSYLYILFLRMYQCEFLLSRQNVVPK